MSRDISALPRFTGPIPEADRRFFRRRPSRTVRLRRAAAAEILRMEEAAGSWTTQPGQVPYVLVLRCGREFLYLPVSAPPDGDAELLGENACRAVFAAKIRSDHELRARVRAHFKQPRNGGAS